MPATKESEELPGQFIEAAAAQVSKVENNASLTGLVGRSVGKLAAAGPYPTGYFRVTDLVNPSGAFWLRRRDVPEPPQILQRLTFGKVRHRQAAFWLSGLEGFVFSEARLEGGYVGIPGVVGKIDFLLGRSILEYKTKSVAPESAEAMWALYPQDIEQTLFYAVLLPGASDEHLLVVHHDSAFRCYRLKVRNKGAILNLLRKRMRDLDEALRTGNPSRLGRCRYLDSGCKFAQAAVCSCSEIVPLDTDMLRNAVEIRRDTILEGAVEIAHESAAPTGNEIWWWDLLAPRRRFLTDSTPEYKQPIWKNACRWLLQEAVRGVPELRADPSHHAGLVANATAMGLRVPTGLIAVKREGQPGGGEVVPYITRASQGNVKREWQVAPYYLAELAIACGVSGSRRGVLFVMYPTDGNKVAAYDVTLKDPVMMRGLVESRVEAIRTAESGEDWSRLPRCPAFMRDGCGPGCLCLSPSPTGDV